VDNIDDNNIDNKKLINNRKSILSTDLDRKFSSDSFDLDETFNKESKKNNTYVEDSKEINEDSYLLGKKYDKNEKNYKK